MATHSRREIVRHTVEYTVPAPWPQGAHVDDIGKAIGAALNEQRQLAAQRGDERLGDTWVRAGVGEIVIVIEKEG